MIMTLYQCPVFIQDKESGEERLQNLYFDTFGDAQEYARYHDVTNITQIVGDIKRVETYGWRPREIERKVIEVQWGWYPIEEKEGEK